MSAASILAAIFGACLAVAVLCGIALIALGVIEADKRERAAMLERENLERAGMRAAGVNRNANEIIV